jgi:broad specificity phosphatase PhoE
MKVRPAAFGTSLDVRRTWARLGRFLGVALIAFTLLIGAAIPAAAAELMRVTFVRHGQSAGNASGNIDTSTPGPVLTQLGQQQAQTVADQLGINNYDAIYGSTMVRTQLTAAPMSQRLGLPIQVLPGLQEIEAGVFEGTPESQAANGYAKFPLAWTFAGQRDLRIPGSINGNEFDARVDGALKTIYDNGDRNAVVFSHGGTIMFWTMMNATNLTMAQKIELLKNAPLDNTDYVVVEGNAEDGWKLVNWNGQQFGTDTTLGAEVQLQMRTLTRQLAATARQVVDAFATLNPATVIAAIIRGVGDATASIAKFAGAVTNKVFQELGKFGAPSQPAQTTNVSALAASAATSTPTPVTANEPAARTMATTSVTTDAVVGDPRKVEPRKGAESTPATEATKLTETTKPEPIEAPKAPATNGATDLKDGNKATPGTTADEHSTTGDKPAVGTTPSVDAATAGTETVGSSESEDAAA